MKLRNIFLLALSFSLIGCGLGNQNVSTLVKIENGFIKGVKEGNIIYLKDATAAQLLSVFGNQNSHKGKLFNWVKPNVSNVYVYYSGHGVPGGDKGDSFLVPSALYLSGKDLCIFLPNSKSLSFFSLSY